MNREKTEAQLRLAVAGGQSKRAVKLALEINEPSGWKDLAERQMIKFADLSRIFDQLEKSSKHTHFVAHAVLDYAINSPTQEELLELALRVTDSSMQYRLWPAITWQGVPKVKAMKIAKRRGWLWTYFWQSLIRAYNLKENDLVQFRQDHGVALMALCEMGRLSKERMWQLATEKQVAWSTVLHCADMTIGELAQLPGLVKGFGGMNGQEDREVYRKKVCQGFRDLDENERIPTFLANVALDPGVYAPFVQVCIFGALDLTTATKKQLEAVGKACGHWGRVLEAGKFSPKEIKGLAEKYDHPDLWKRVG